MKCPLCDSEDITKNADGDFFCINCGAEVSEDDLEDAEDDDDYDSDFDDDDEDEELEDITADEVDDDKEKAE